MYVCVQVWESEWLVCDMQIWNNGTLNVYDASVVGLRSFFGLWLLGWLTSLVGLTVFTATAAVLPSRSLFRCWCGIITPKCYKNPFCLVSFISFVALQR